MNKVRVLIVEDHDMARMGLSVILSSNERIQPLIEANSCPLFLCIIFLNKKRILDISS